MKERLTYLAHSCREGLMLPCQLLRIFVLYSGESADEYFVARWPQESTVMVYFKYATGRTEEDD